MSNPIVPVPNEESPLENELIPHENMDLEEQPQEIQSLITFLQEQPEPRRRQVRKHPLINILFIIICGLICGANTISDIAFWAENHQEWLKDKIDISQGTPSHDTIGRVLSLLESNTLKNGYQNWITDLKQNITQGNNTLHLGQEVIAIDGKIIKASFDNFLEQKATHLVRAWSHQRGITLAHEKVEDKQNEIVALPKILAALHLKGVLVTIDALGTQKSIADLIREKGGDYLLSLRGNHGILHDRVLDNVEDWMRRSWDIPFSYTYAESLEKSHGSVICRRCWVVESAFFLDLNNEWRDLYGVCVVEREIRNAKGVYRSCRHYLTNISDASLCLFGSRSHWEVENCMHWVLDVVFREDVSRVRLSHASMNFSILREVVLLLLRRVSLKGAGLQRKRMKAAWDLSFLEEILAA
jgi:predicted transposase YbfD/YdcC